MNKKDPIGIANRAVSIDKMPDREYYLKNKDRLSEKSREYYLKNKDRLSEKRREYNRKYYLENRYNLKSLKKRREYNRKYYLKIKAKNTMSIRNLIWRTL